MHRSLALAAILLTAANAFAAPLRITQWNLGEPVNSSTNRPSTASPARRIQDAAAALKKLNPDVIFLQDVRDWQMCNDLARALRPTNYSVLVCSAFRDAQTGASSKRQVAVLSKRKAYFFWSEPWRADGEMVVPGGFVFAAIHSDGQNVGLFAVQLGEVTTSVDAAVIAHAQAACVAQWVQQVDSFKHWETNRFDTAVVGGQRLAPDPARPESAKFADNLLLAAWKNPMRLPAAGAQATAPDFVSARLLPDATTLPAVVLDRSPSTCDLEFGPASPVVPVVAEAVKPPVTTQTHETTAVTAKPQSGPAETAAVQPAQPVQTHPPVPAAQAAPAVAANKQVWIWSGVGGGLLVFAMLVWIWARRKPAPATATLSLVRQEGGSDVSSSGTVVFASHSITGSATEGSGPVPTVRPVIHVSASGAAQGDSEEWRRRALAAEQRAERAVATARSSVVAQFREWMKQKLVRKLVEDRAELLEAQQAATLRAMAVDERLTRIELQINQQNLAYERRIDELTRELAAAKEENRELIRAKIAQVKAEMEAARARLLKQAEEKG